MTHLKSVFVQIILFLIISVITADAATTGVRSYFPLNHEDFKKYGPITKMISSTVRAITTVDYLYLSFGSVGNFIELELGGGDNSNVTYRHAGKTLEMTAAGLPINGSLVSFNFSRPLVIFTDHTIVNGGTTTSNTVASDGINNYEVSSKTVVRDAGNVSVPAGYYKNCRHISFDVTIRSVGVSQSITMKNAWVLAPGVGKIKVAVIDPSTQKITSYLPLLEGNVGGKNVSEWASTIAMPWLKLLL